MHIPLCLWFSAKVVQFNRERATPDVSQEENPHIPSETGFRCSHIRYTNLLKCGCWLEMLLNKCNPCQQWGSIKGACVFIPIREGSNLEEVVEKQADLIEYLKQHNTLLSKRLLNLTAQH